VLLEVPSAELSHPKYRADIDGLRAIAVLSVIFFHAFPDTFRGGFIGVDIFFVISGFLITTIIFDNLRTGSFTFRGFYVNRIIRIFPSLIVVLIATLLIGWVTLLPYDFMKLAREAAAGATFLANFFYWGEANYFDIAAVRKPLLHLWSLGIEEQFYIAWPAILWLSWRWRLNAFVITLVIVGISFTASLYQTATDPVAAFYAPYTRFWELLVGGLLAYPPPVALAHRKNLLAVFLYGPNTRAVFGGGLIAIGLMLISSQKAFPGWWALLPTMGTLALISAGERAWINRTILSTRALVRLGLISYPLYLWHWPLLSFAQTLRGERPTTALLRVAIIAISIALAWATFRYIETPIRARKKLAVIWQGAAALMLGTAAMAGIIIVHFNEAQDELTKLSRVQAILDHFQTLYGTHSCFRFEINNTYEMFLRHDCFKIEYPGRPIVLLIGDSHSASLSLGLRPLLEGLRINILQVSTGWCTPTTIDPSNTRCNDINNMTFNKIREIHPDLTIVDENWVGSASTPPYYGDKLHFKDHFLERLNYFQGLGAQKILIVGQIPTWRISLPDVLIKNFAMKNAPVPIRTFDGVEPASLEMDAFMRALPLPTGVDYTSVKDVLCDQRGCMTAIGPDIENDLVVWDYGHLLPNASKYVAEHLFAESIRRMLPPNTIVTGPH
jgi:peptidoglycan/LPS O-acetylase OafA/YrhL